MTGTAGDAAPRTPGAIIKALLDGAFATLEKVPQGGALQARRLAGGGVMLYWRYTANGKTDRVAIGTYDAVAPPRSLKPSERGYSIAAALRECEARANVQAAHRDTGGYRAIKATQRAEFVARQEAERDRSQHTLRALLHDYCDYLEKLGRRSHAEARGNFRRHIFEPAPALSNTAAAHVTTDDVIDLLRTLNQAGKGRTANKLRSYLHAAYRVAMAAKSKASIPVAFKAYGITANPVAQTDRDAAHDRSDKNPLSAAELRAYWKAIKALPDLRGAALRLHLLTGGQRIEQLMRLRRQHVTAEGITIFDAKGKPGNPPRAHLLPLIPAALDAVRTLPAGTGEFALSNDGGTTPLNAVTLAKWAQAVEHGIPEFQLKRVRSGVETLLSSLGIGKDIRGELQSQGLSGVQKRHYDAHDYLPEKRRALMALFKALEAKPAGKVVSLRAA